MTSVPKVSLILLNYNSARIRDIVDRAISGIANLDYPNFEVVVVDNGSTDRSRERVFDLVSKISVPSKEIRSDTNLGFARGNNLGFKEVDPDTKYVCLINNDLYPYRESLRIMIDALERDATLGAVYAIQLEWRSDVIDSYGYMLTELLGHCWWCAENQFKQSSSVEAPMTFPLGAYFVIRREICDRWGKVFPDDDLFFGAEDELVGLRLWDMGYRVVGHMQARGEHYGSLTFKTLQLSSYKEGYKRGYLLGITNSRFRELLRLSMLSDIGAKGVSWSSHAYLDGVRHGYQSGSNQKRLDMYRAPIMRVNPLKAIAMMLVPGPVRDFVISVRNRQ